MFKISRLLLIFLIAIACAFGFIAVSDFKVTFDMHDGTRTLLMKHFILYAVIVFIGLYLTIRFLLNVLLLPERARRWKALKGERYSNARLNEASLQYFSGQYDHSLKNVKKALQFYEKNDHFLDTAEGATEFYVLANLLGAANENRLGHEENASTMMQKAISYSKKSKLSEAPDGLKLLQIEWLVNNNQIEKAKELFNKLDPSATKRVSALQLQLKIDHIQNQPLAVLKTAKRLAKHREYSHEDAEKIVVESAIKLLGATNDVQNLQATWDSLDRKERKLPAIIAYTARHFAILGDSQSAHKHVQSLWNHLNDIPSETKDNLLMTLDMTLEDTNAKWVSRLEKSLQHTPNDAMMIYLLGRLYHIKGMDAKASSLLEQAARSLELPILLRQRAWFLIAQEAEKTGELAQANAYYKEAVELLS